MKAISSFGDILLLSKNDLSAHHITTYLVDVARKLHNFYEKCRVISQDNRRLSYARLALLKAVRKIIRSGLDVIGVSAPQKM
jgi:arginyl-tRNA synthetase